MHRTTIILFALAISLALPRGAGVVHAGPQENVNDAKVAAVHAAFLVNFLRYVKWPEAALGDAGSSLRIVVIGGDHFGSALDAALKDKAIQNRGVIARRLTLAPPGPDSGSPWPEESMTMVRGAHILYLEPVDASIRDAVLRVVKDLPVLTVSHVSDFARNQGMIGLVIRDGKVAFEVHRKRLEAAGLKASAKLLDLADIVGD